MASSIISLRILFYRTSNYNDGRITQTKDDLMVDFVAIITSMTAKIYGLRGNKKRVKQIKDCVEQSGDK